MSWWTEFRDSLQTAATIIGNFYLPGIGYLGAKYINSEGSKEQLLGTDWGQAALMLSSIGGSLSGNGLGYTGGESWGGTTAAAASNAPQLFDAAGTSGSWGSYEGFANAFDPDALMAARAMADSGSSGADIIQATGMSPAQLEAAGISAGNNVTWIDAAQSAGVPYGGNNAGSVGDYTGYALNGSPVTQGGRPLGASMSAPAVTARTAGAMPWGSAASNINVGQSGYGLMASRMLMNAGLSAQQAADPFGSQRKYYLQRMQELERNPGMITSMPGYRAGLEAVQNAGAAQGFTGGGNMMAGLQKYGGDFYNQTMDRYATLAGAGFNPAAGAQFRMQGLQSGIDLAGNSLNRLGYTAYMADNDPYRMNRYNPGN